jgi:hypothetical protein
VGMESCPAGTSCARVDDWLTDESLGQDAALAALLSVYHMFPEAARQVTCSEGQRVVGISA